MLDKTKTLEEQAKQASNLRNEIRTNARQAMKDKDIADFLDAKEANMIWEDMFPKIEIEILAQPKISF